MEGCAVWGPRLESLQRNFSEAWMKANPNFQMKFGYDPDPPLEANYALCSNLIAQKFDCLAVTFEMPFKECINSKGIEVPWLNEEAEVMGASVLNAISEILHQLRG